MTGIVGYAQMDFQSIRNAEVISLLPFWSVFDWLGIVETIFLFFINDKENILKLDKAFTVKLSNSNDLVM